MICAENLFYGFAVRDLKLENEKMHIEVVHVLFWTSVSTIGLSERGLNLILHVTFRQCNFICVENLF